MAETEKGDVEWAWARLERRAAAARDRGLVLGATVRHRLGGPLMTVEELLDGRGPAMRVRCRWFRMKKTKRWGGQEYPAWKLESAVFFAAELRRVGADGPFGRLQSALEAIDHGMWSGKGRRF